MSVCVHLEAVQLDGMWCKYCSWWLCHAFTKRPLANSDSGNSNCACISPAAVLSLGTCGRMFDELAKRSWSMRLAIDGFVGRADNLLCSFWRSSVINCMAVMSGHWTTCNVVSLACRHLGHLLLAPNPILFMYLPVASRSMDILQTNRLMHPLAVFHANWVLVLSIMWNCRSNSLVFAACRMRLVSLSRIVR